MLKEHLDMKDTNILLQGRKNKIAYLLPFTQSIRKIRKKNIYIVQRDTQCGFTK